MKNDEKLREQLRSEPVPEQLRPENVRLMLKGEAAKEKRKSISVAGRIMAAAAACTVICGTAVYTLNNGKNNIKTFAPVKNGDTATTAPGSGEPDEVRKLTSYMSGASDYKEVYTLFNKAAKKAEKERKSYADAGDIFKEEAESVDESALTGRQTYGANVKDAEDGALSETPVIQNELPAEPVPDPVTEPVTELSTEPSEPKEEDPGHSETYYQEQDVLEADIVKTDGKHIYYLCNADNEDFYSSPVLRTADVKDGKFTGSTTLELDDAIDNRDSSYMVFPVDMYIYNDMIAVICSSDCCNYYYDDEDEYNENDVSYTFVAFYTTGDEPELIDVYRQDGNYHDVRISPEGYMLLTSHFYSCSFGTIRKSDDTRRYIPYCGFEESYDIIPAEDILLPADGFGSTDILSYTVVGSIDLNNAGAPEKKDVKSLAGYTGSIYCSAENLYTAADGSELSTTDITRISITGGDIVPMAGTTINGYVKDQFSMSEYDGYFRVAATYTETRKTFHKTADNGNILEDFWDRITNEEGIGYYTYEHIKTDTHIYVLDMDMNIVGSIGGLGVDEQLRSASFSGNTAYVVTFRQTDPLYAVDLSDPANPVLLDELKINGFSTYMQQWSDGLLLGFGQDADDTGRITGVKMTMFDNSDPNDLKAEAVYTWNNFPGSYIYDGDTKEYTEEWYYSPAVNEWKALLIAPEKNLIGVPIDYHRYAYSSNSVKQYDNIHRTQYVFFSYENGEFVQKGDISKEYEDYLYNVYNRAVYIGDYIYVLSSDKFVAADINTIEVTGELTF